MHACDMMHSTFKYSWEHNNINMSEACEEAILQHLSSPDAVIEDTFTWSPSKNLDHNAVVGSVKSLSADAYVSATELTSSFFTLSKEAADVVANGSQEIRVLAALVEAGEEGLSMPDLQAKVGKNVCKIGMGNCMKNKWAKKNGANLVAIKTMEEVSDETQAQLKALEAADGVAEGAIDSKQVNLLKRRKLITQVTRKSYSVVRGAEYAPKRVKKAADLTKEMLDSGAWKTTPFKPYSFLAVGEKVGGGYLHPLLKVRAEFRKILMQMGFAEMPTNKWVESSFWNFDSLFQPQSHPARDAHDTFFIKEPAATVSVPEDYYERVKEMHEKGGAGSIGYRYDFKKEGKFVICNLYVKMKLHSLLEC
jgi:phenylalanyl-tRNA synthetase alpha chain